MVNDEKIVADAEAMASAIGKFIQNFNVLDIRLNYVLGILLNREDIAVGEIVGAALMFDNKRKLIKALLHQECGTEAAEGYTDLDARIRQINTFRTQLVHGEQWIEFEGALRQRSARVTDKGYSPKHTSYSPEEVFEEAAKAVDLDADLWAYIRGVLDHKAEIENEV